MTIKIRETHTYTTHKYCDPLPGRTLTCTVERSVLDLDRGGEPLYFRPVRGGVQRANLSRASAQVRADSPRFTFVSSLFIIRKHVIDENLSSFVYFRKETN